MKVSRKIKNIIALIALLILIQIAGCAVGPTAGQLYFGNYSKSLYNLKKSPNPAMLSAHQENLLSIINRAQNVKAIVPPSLYGELGFTYYQQNKFEEASRYFELEKQHYPESTQLMNHMINLAKEPKK